ncbi:hypothetical protein HPB49_023007 [Dermacentor silvarum]|uniref:Uncharacterized protein n=1 Tax=Dermacentor silvarum TaxID=543639 RepID=A0ACB8DR93_DERSI|nr:hypothetical protein HPB49_023007 [Dermacentor silvarum]
MSRHTFKRQLTGFGELLDWRLLEFADTVPNVFSCTLCGVLPAFPKRLTPCCHVFCQQCFEKLAEREHRCPLDQTPFADDAVETLDSVHGGVNRLRARCPNASSGCPFVGALPELKEHIAGRCDHNEVQCPRCGATVLQRTALNHYLEDCGGKGKVATPVTSETSSVASAERSEEDASRKSNRRSKSAKKLHKAKRSGDVSSGTRKSTSVEDAAAAHKPQIVAAIRSLLQESHGGSIRSATCNVSQTPSIETSLIKSDRKGATLSKPDLQCSQSTTAKVSKSAGSVQQEMDKGLSEKQLIDKVDSMLAKAMEAASAVVAAVAPPPATAEEEASKSSSSSSGSSNKSASSSSSPRHRGRKHDASKRAKGVARVGASSPPGFACCYITGIVGAESRIACGEELVLRSDSFRLADCTFRVHARLRRDAEGSVLVCFTLCLCGGTWHQVADWALANKVSLLLVHPWDQALNRRLPLCLNPDAVP